MTKSNLKRRTREKVNRPSNKRLTHQPLIIFSSGVLAPDQGALSLSQRPTRSHQPSTQPCLTVQVNFLASYLFGPQYVKFRYICGSIIWGFNLTRICLYRFSMSHVSWSWGLGAQVKRSWINLMRIWRRILVALFYSFWLLIRPDSPTKIYYILYYFLIWPLYCICLSSKI